MFRQFGSVEQKAADRAFHNALLSLNNEVGEGCQPGRMLKFGVADGYAIYIINRVNSKTGQVTHIPYADGYRSAAVNRDNEVWRDEAEDNIAWYDTLKAMSDKAKQLPAEPPLPVVLAEA